MVDLCSFLLIRLEVMEVSDLEYFDESKYYYSLLSKSLYQSCVSLFNLSLILQSLFLYQSTHNLLSYENLLFL